MSQKTITVYNGTTSKVISSSAVTWGNLKNELANQGITTSNMRVFIGQNQTELSVNSALLPDSDEFDLFLTPKKNKSGLSLRSREACYTIAKEARAEYDEAINYFPSYSSMTTEKLNEAVDSWFEYLDSLEEEEAEVEETETIDISQIIEDLNTSKDKIQEAIEVLEGLEGNKRDLRSKYNSIVSQLDSE